MVILCQWLSNIASKATILNCRKTENKTYVVKKTEINKWFEKSKKLFKNGEYDNSLNILNQILKFEPNNITPNFY